MDLKPLQCITTASSYLDFDDDGHELGITLAEDLFENEDGKNYRLVEYPNEYWKKEQIDKYQKEPNVVIQTQEQLDWWLKYGRITPSSNPTVYYRKQYDFNFIWDFETETIIKIVDEIIKPLMARKEFWFGSVDGSDRYELVTSNPDHLQKIEQILTEIKEKYGKLDSERIKR